MSSTVDTVSRPDDLVALGHITGAFGIKGWVKVHPYAVDSAALLGAKVWWLTPARSSGAVATAVAVQVSTARTHGAMVIARLAGIEEREQAEAWRGHLVQVSRAVFPSTDDDEYYWVDLVGCTLWGHDPDGAAVPIGVVTHVSDNGAHAVLEVQPPQSDVRRPAVLVPFVAAHIEHVDIAGRRIVSNWPNEF